MNIEDVREKYVRAYPNLDILSNKDRYIAWLEQTICENYERMEELELDIASLGWESWGEYL